MLCAVANKVMNGVRNTEIALTKQEHATMKESKEAISNMVVYNPRN